MTIDLSCRQQLSVVLAEPTFACVIICFIFLIIILQLCVQNKYHKLLLFVGIFQCQYPFIRENIYWRNCKPLKNKWNKMIKKSSFRIFIKAILWGGGKWQLLTLLNKILYVTSCHKLIDILNCLNFTILQGWKYLSFAVTGLISILLLIAT